MNKVKTQLLFRDKIIKSFWPFFLALFLFCTALEDQEINLTFWAMGAEGEYINELIPEFEALHPDIRVRIQSIPWSVAHEKLLTAFAGQSTPDVCQLGNTWIPEFQAIGALLALDSLIAHAATLSQASYFEGIWNTNVIGKQVYGVPWYVDTRLLFYRTDILAQAGYSAPPKTWDEWRDIALKIKKQTPLSFQRYAVYFSLIYNDWAVPVILILQNGGRLLKNNDCYGAFDDSATVQALRFYLSFFKDDLALRSMTEVTNIYQGFSEGLFSMMVNGPWNVNEIRKRVPELASRWNTAPLPCQQNCCSIAGGASLVIFNNAKNPQAAWKLIEFLARPDIQLKFFQLTRDLPAVKAAWQSPIIQSDEQIGAFYTQLENVVPTPKIAEWEQIAVKIQEHLEKVVFERMSLSEAVVALNQEVNRILEKRRWLLSNNLIQ